MDPTPCNRPRYRGGRDGTPGGGERRNPLDALAALGWEAWLALGVVVGATFAMAREWLAPDLVMFSGLSVLVVAGVLTPAEATAGFAETAVFTIGVLFVCAAAMRETGALRVLSKVIFGRTRTPGWALARLVAPTALLSGVMNNTPIVAMFIPMVRTFALRIGMAPSQMLIPLAYAAMFGGTCTVIGTSSNLVVSSLLEREALGAIGMFEIGWIGLPSTVIGLVYLLTIGRHLLPSNADRLATLNEEAREYLAEVALEPGSDLVGSTVEEADLRNLPGLFLAELRRADGRVRRPVAPETQMLAGDHLIFTGRAEDLSLLLEQHPGLAPVDDVEVEQRALYEVVISHRSSLVGRTVRSADFRRRFGAAILAVHRSGERLDEQIGEVVMRAGDTLILLASPGFYRTFKNSSLFYMVSEVQTELPTLQRKAGLTMATLVGLVLAPSVLGVPMLVSAMGALLLLLVVFRAISVRAAREAVSWNVLVLIGSAFGVAAAMQKTGMADAIGKVLVSATGPFGPHVTLAAVYVAGVVFASFISNAAAAALLFPIALTAAQAGGFDPRPFAIALAMAASAGFSTPIGCQANLLVYGPGGYRYLDYARVGIPLNLLFATVAIAGIPWLWPFHAP